MTHRDRYAIAALFSFLAGVCSFFAAFGWELLTGKPSRVHNLPQLPFLTIDTDKLLYIGTWFLFWIAAAAATWLWLQSGRQTLRPPEA